MRVKRNGIMLVAVVILLAVACASNGSQPKPQQTTDIFADEKDGILTVQNQTGIDIVLFAGDLRRGMVLGGIRANSIRNFDISKIANIPEKEAFIIRGVPSIMHQQRNGRLTESDVLYTGLVVFDPKATNKIVKLIPAEIDETMSFSVFVSNNSRTVCELRINDADGPAIAALSPFQQNKAIWIKPSPFGQPFIILPIYFSIDSDGTIHESVPSPYDGQRIIPEPRGGGIRVLELKNTANGDGQLNLLFE